MLFYLESYFWKLGHLDFFNLRHLELKDPFIDKKKTISIIM